MSEWHGGKGSKRRPETDTRYQDNWEKIFNKKKGGKMPIKIKKSEQVADRQTGKVTTTHHYAKCASVEELHELIAKESTKPKIKLKCQNELIKRRKK